MARGNAAPKERLEGIETLLLWEGRVSNGRLRDFYPVHAVQASRDIASYRLLAPDSCEADLSFKGFIAKPFIKPLLTQGTFLEYQQLIGAAGDTTKLLAGVPTEFVNLDVTATTPDIFVRLHSAIRHGRAVNIHYRSLTNPELHERAIRPHSFIQAGPRWHVRAYCAKAAAFRDFNLGRITQANEIDATGLLPIEADHEWSTFVTLRLIPHQDLAPAQKVVIREEYMKGTTALVFKQRVPLIRYLIQAFRAAIDPSKQCPPEFLMMVDESIVDPLIVIKSNNSV